MRLFFGKWFNSDQIQHRLSQLTKKLKDYGVKRGSLLYVTLEPGVELILVFLSCLDIQCVYIPMLKPKLSSECFVIGPCDLNLECLDQELQLWKHDGPSDPFYLKNDICYCMSTSGTTRKQQGIKIYVPRQSMESNVKAIQKRLTITHDDTLMLLAPPTFDPSIVEILCAKHANLIILPRSDIVKGHLEPMVFECTCLMMTPTLFLRLKQETRSKILSGQSRVTRLVLGGEQIPLSLCREPRKIELWNIYGTTECSIWATLTLVQDAPFIEHALDDTVIEVRDQELWIGGEKRICYLEGEQEPQIMRPTGDLVEQTDNRIKWIGRTDSIIKISGYRISLNLISDLICQHESVSRCETLVDDPFVISFVASCNDILLSEIEALFSDLEHFRKPSHIYMYKALPMNRNGKVDRKQLLEDAKDKRSQSVMDVLGQYLSKHQEIDTQRFFVELGGSSLDAMRIVATLSLDMESLEILMNQPLFVFLEHLTQKKSKRFKRETKWTVNLGKCVDANPVLHRDRIYIGSHAGLFCCIDLLGTIVWRHQLERIETSCVIVSDLVIVPTHEWHLYSFYLDGRKHDVFKLPDLVKYTPVQEPNTSKIWFSCFDRHLYCLSYESQPVLVKKIPLSSPGTNLTIQDKIYCPTLDGTLYILDLNGNQLSQYQTNKPIFSKPLVLSNSRVLITSVDHYVHCLSNNTLLWKTNLQAPIFGAPHLFQDTILVGTHGSQLFQLTLDGLVIKSIDFGAPIAAEPYSFKHQVVVAAIDGTIRVLDKNLEMAREIKTGTTFSRPILFENGLVYGGRDDAVHCL